MKYFATIRCDSPGCTVVASASGPSPHEASRNAIELAVRTGFHVATDRLFTEDLRGQDLCLNHRPTKGST